MQFGYFTLSDNHYLDNRRAANTLIADILDEAVYADAIGMHRRGSASIISARWASFPVRGWCWPKSRRAPTISASRRR
jgi:hypothetical protein